jgi:hypothetical protein
MPPAGIRTIEKVYFAMLKELTEQFEELKADTVYGHTVGKHHA